MISCILVKGTDLAHLFELPHFGFIIDRKAALISGNYVQLVLEKTSPKVRKVSGVCWIVEQSLVVQPQDVTIEKLQELPVLYVETRDAMEVSNIVAVERPTCLRLPMNLQWLGLFQQLLRLPHPKSHQHPRHHRVQPSPPELPLWNISSQPSITIIRPLARTIIVEPVFILWEPAKLSNGPSILFNRNANLLHTLEQQWYVFPPQFDRIDHRESLSSPIPHNVLFINLYTGRTCYSGETEHCEQFWYSVDVRHQFEQLVTWVFANCSLSIISVHFIYNDEFPLSTGDYAFVKLTQKQDINMNTGFRWLWIGCKKQAAPFETYTLKNMLMVSCTK